MKVTIYLYLESRYRRSNDHACMSSAHALLQTVERAGIFTNVTRQFICRSLLCFTKSCKQLVWRQITSLVWGRHCDRVPGSRSRWVRIDQLTRRHTETTNLYSMTTFTPTTKYSQWHNLFLTSTNDYGIFIHDWLEIKGSKNFYTSTVKVQLLSKSVTWNV